MWENSPQYAQFISIFTWLFMKICYYTTIQSHDSAKENVDDPEAEVTLNVDNDEKEEKVC